LLTKIENQEFSTRQTSNLSKVVDRVSTQFEELAQMKGLRLEKRILPDVSLRIDPILTDVMVTNLMKNALQHNIKNGWIEIEVNKHQLIVINTGQPPEGPIDQLFERFKKSKASNETLGLGLAIVKKIAEVNQMDVTYQYSDGIHEVKVDF